MALKCIIVAMAIATVVVAYALAEEIITEENGMNLDNMYGKESFGAMMNTQLSKVNIASKLAACVGLSCDDDPDVCEPDCDCGHIYNLGPGRDEPPAEGTFICTLKQDD